jgi:hypothetical protein
MKKENGIILYGAGEFGTQALNFFGFRNVYCFVDNSKAGSLKNGKNVISFDTLMDIYADYEIIIAVNISYVSEIEEQLNRFGIPYGVFVDIQREYTYRNAPSNPRIAKWHGTYKGKKCFLIGNGPSLTVQDLENLASKGFITITCNYINKIFDKTKWRPDFYCIIETSAILTNLDFIMNFPMKAKFVKDISPEGYTDVLDESKCENLCLFNYGGAHNCFSTDCSKVIYDGHTVMFSMIQMAVYLRFAEIYMLGVDNTQPPFVYTSNFIESHSHFYEESKDELEKRRKILPSHNRNDKDDWEAYQQNLNKYYVIAKKYAEEHNVKIYNATRGGKLEIFERIDFDEVMKFETKDK